MITKIHRTPKEKQREEENKRDGKNIISTISKSNRRKIRVKKKYRKEKGTRERLWCSNPHSNEDISSRIIGDFSETKNAKTLSRRTMRKLIRRERETKNIQLKEDLSYKCKL